MSNNSKSSDRDRFSSAAVDTTLPPTPGPLHARSGSFRKMPSDPGVLAAKGWSFDGTLQRVLGFSRAAELEGARHPAARSEHSGPAPHGHQIEPPSPAFDALRLFVRTLEPETQDKLRTLMRAGCEALALPVALAALAAERTNGGSTAELFARGMAELQDLQRGHAIACATSFDLELDLALWGTIREPPSLDERVWLRFGRELARSRIEEWACFAVVDSHERLQKLYLRRGKTRWWSFAALIDRPSDRSLGVPRPARSGRGGMIVVPVRTALGRSCSANLRAVRRASRALGARLGQCGPAAGRAAATAASKVET